MTLGRILVELKRLGTTLAVKDSGVVLLPAGDSPVQLPSALLQAVRDHKDHLIARLEEEQGPYIESPRYWQIDKLYCAVKSAKVRAEQGGANVEEAVVLLSLVREWDDACYEGWEEADQWEAENGERIGRLCEQVDECLVEGDDLLSLVHDTFPGSTLKRNQRNKEAA